MSRYLVDRVRSLNNVEVVTGAAISGLEGHDGILEAVRWRFGATGQEERRPIRHLFLFIGAEPNTDWLRGFLNQMSAVIALMSGASGFFRPRIPNPWFHPPGTVEATSFYDTLQLKATLEALIDFDRLNSDHAKPRLSLGAVNVRSGNLVYFDSSRQVIKPEHVMASGALPPGFPAVEIEGEHYWDGGLVSNTPLQWIAMTQRPPDSLVFQVDLWSAQGELPRRAEYDRRQAVLSESQADVIFDAQFRCVAGDDRGINRSYRDAGDPIGMEVRLRQCFINPSLELRNFTCSLCFISSGSSSRSAASMLRDRRRRRPRRRRDLERQVSCRSPGG